MLDHAGSARPANGEACILLITLGSHGDVLPFVGLGAVLRRRGWRAILATNEHFKNLAKTQGLEFAPLGTDSQYQSIIRDPDIWHPRKGFAAIFSRAVGPLIEMTYRLIEQQYQPGRMVVVASSLALGARLAQEKLGVPTATVHLQPSVMRTVYDVPRLPGLVMPAWTPRGIKRAVWSLADKLVIDPVVAPPVNELRRRLGLPPVRNLLDGWWHSPARVIGLWPEWFAAVQPDWPPQTRLVGFPLFDPSGLANMPGELEDWLAAGAPPVVFTFGSAMVHGKRFFSQSAQACARLDCRGLLLTRFAEQIPRSLPPMVRHVPYAPFGLLLKRCAAVVHHGGIGTCSQALHAGLPQLIVPMSHDQFDNARRLRRLGVGRELAAGAYRAGRVARLLRELMNQPQVRDRARQVAGLLCTAGKPALDAAAQLIEDLIPQGAGAMNGSSVAAEQHGQK
ncbi:glycosyltransferase [Fontivita pretiosa]|uniref:glycosyltransferase n=1 Tax=Fontivita pretiosa TaxID=2989684 RepID=UPI003D175011